MKYTVKYYDPKSDDFQLLSSFVQKHSNHISENTSWSFQRFIDWRYGHIAQEEEFCSKTLIKFLDETNEILGVAINEDGRDMLTLLTDKVSPELFERFLHDAIERLMQGVNPLYMEVSEKQEMEKACIEKMGFVVAGESKKMRYTLESLEFKDTYSMEGFRVVRMSEEPLYEKQGRLRASAFQGKDNITDEEVLERLKTIQIMKQSPTFNPSTDILIINDEGIAVAGCEPLVNFETKDAEIERVCTHRDFRNRGFSRMVITEAMKSLKNEGIKVAYLSGWNDTTIHLYQSFGPHEVLNIYQYRLER